MVKTTMNKSKRINKSHKRSKKSVRNNSSKSINKSKKYMNDPIGHRRYLYGKEFDTCYDKLLEIRKNTKSGQTTSKSNKEAIAYLKKHLPKCIEIIGDYLIDH